MFITYELTLASGFGQRPNINGGILNEFHYGADFVEGVGEGVSALSIGDGVVVEAYNGTPAEEIGNIGHNVIVRQNDGNYVQYGHLGNVSVVESQTVNAGVQLGGIGNTGFNTTGPHLHIGVSCDVESSTVYNGNQTPIRDALQLSTECNKAPLQVFPHIGRLFEMPAG